ncbi:hypothetical protein EIP75_21535 [Aquabacterium soli]|uniref:DeoxyPurine in DNA protein A domain-containing protein n=1 Tax=Aquabacterium soli TaxID=2493092 RepID=A0A426V2U2_9BURK|nr:hypothetical protein [Aquabacterium soli]RRS01161.1 hypothetical protein EIP75_21535 [Aquabacterium soli]
MVSARHQPIPTVRVGVPLPGGQLVAAARDKGYPVLFSANAFARTWPRGHEREGFFKGFRLPDPAQFDGLDAALDSAGFVAAVRYGDYRWTVEDYFDLVQAYPWAWYAAMDYCCEPQIAQDRPLRLLRMAATAYMLGQCRKEASDRQLPPPMPVLQGWTPDEYATCAAWLPLMEWPDLVGLGSVCRRPVHGDTGILAILEAVDQVLPAHVRLHLFGVKSTALERLASHHRVASVDSMAWDVQARAERRTGRDMAFRISHMAAWADRQRSIAARSRAAMSVQTMLFDPAEFGGFSSTDELVMEAAALQYADLVMGGDLEYRDAVHYCHQDGTIALAIARRNGLSAEMLAECDDMLEGFGTRISNLQESWGAGCTALPSPFGPERTSHATAAA